jgi:hypothetical protein
VQQVGSSALAKKAGDWGEERPVEATDDGEDERGRGEPMDDANHQPQLPSLDERVPQPPQVTHGDMPGSYVQRVRLDKTYGIIIQL